MTDFTPERIAQLREILAKHSPPAVSCAMENLPAALDEIERLSAERDSLIDQVRAMSGVSATLSRVTAERDEAVRVMEPFARAVEKADGRARGSGFAPSSDIYRTLWEFSFGELRAARSFLSRMGGRK